MLYRYRLSTDDLPTVTPSSYRPTSPSREVGSSVGREPFFPSRPEYPDVVPVIISPNRKLRRVPLVSGRSLGDRENDGHGGTTRPQLKKRSPFSLGSASFRKVDYSLDGERSSSGAQGVELSWKNEPRWGTPASTGYASQLENLQAAEPVPSVRTSLAETLLADPIDRENTRKLALFGGIREHRPTQREASQASPKGR